jgi:hypothetical protein
MKPLMKYHVDLETQEGKTVKTWGVMPVLNTTKILDGLFDPETKILKLLLDPVHEQYVDMPVQDKKTGKWDMVNRKMLTHYRGSIKQEDLEFFLNTYVENNFEYQMPSNLILPEHIDEAPVTLVND